MAHQPERRSFIPASGFRWLTAFYDPVLAHLLREETWKAALVEQVAPQAGERILYLGCGTGTLSVLIKKAAPSAEVVGLDPDPEVLKRARHKAESAGLAITWQQGFADQPGEEGDYDKAVSSLMFHHLATEAKQRALASVLDQLKPGGELHIADWGRPQNLAMRVMFLPVQILDGFATTRDNVQGRLPEFMRAVGFEEVAETRQWSTALGSLSFYRARKPC
jgi:ubiquinone/menaquinone biosynthesis C-methylase UbiE